MRSILREIGFLQSVIFFALCLSAGQPERPEPVWSKPITAAKGSQVDAVADEKGVVHLLSSQYVQIDRSGNVLLTEDVGDERQGDLDFPPAIAVGKGGAAHIVTRQGGDWNSGHEIRYRRRNHEGKWDLDLFVGKPVPRNYCVGAAVTSDGRVYVCHSVHPPEENMNSYVEFYEVVKDEVKHIGRLEGSRYFRADDTQRMRAAGPFVHIATGSPWPSGHVHYFVGASGRGLPREIKTHTEGTGRKGFPWLYADGKGFVHFTYGSVQDVWYNKYTYDGRKAFPKDIKVAGDLGKWHMSIGLSVVAASDDGKKVVVVAVKTDDVKEIPNGTLLWRYSPDWGMHWSEMKETGFQVNGGEGRRRPGLAAVGDRFFLFFSKGQGVQMSMLDLSVLSSRKKGR